MPPSHDAANSVPLLVATPGFAHWLDDSHPFLGQVLGRLGAGISKSSSLYAIAAVIDRLPGSPAQHRESKQNTNENASFDALESEGLSLLVVHKEDVYCKAAPQRRIGGPAGEEPDLAIAVQNDKTTGHSIGSAYEVGLRLANTVFINGKESTLFGVRGSYDKDASAYTLDKKADLTSCVVTSTSTTVYPELALPLHPVSERRRVITSMGNILRQVAKSTDPASVDPMPASSELQKEIPRYIEENNILDQRVSVWALVEKPDLVVAEHSPDSQGRVAQSLRQGGKLHRVMSGGGGWGKKQGLLSLDPEVSFPGTARRHELVGLEELFDPNPNAPVEMPSFLRKEMYGDDLSLLSQVATAGDFIQFFVGAEPAPQYNDNIPDSPDNRSVTYQFGVVSDFDDAVVPDRSENQQALFMLSNSFGALSEKAIAYSQPQAQASSSSTKLDIPGCRVTLNSVQS